MVILGLSDGAVPGAAVVVDDRLVAAEEAHPSELGPPLPLAAARRALRTAGLGPGDVDAAALAGRFTPPLAIRRRARLRRWAEDPFSPTRALTTRVERFLRGTGLGAADADRARDWLGGRLAAEGFAPRKVTVVDIHKALASSVYRTGDADRATIVVVQPDGDGVFASVHRAAGGQIDRVLADRATTGVHLFLARALAALGVPDLRALAGLAGTSEPDPALRDELTDAVSFRGRFAGRPGPERRRERPWSTLRRRPAEGAATVLAHLGEVCRELVRAHHVDGALQVAGAWFTDPGLLSLQTPVQVSAWRGDGALAVGAAVDAAGLTPSVPPAALGAPILPEGDGDERVAPADAAAVLASGGLWVRARGRGAPGLLAARNRGVWVRADEPRLVARVREVLEIPAAAPPVLLRRTPPPGLPDHLLPAWTAGVTVGGRTFVGTGGDPELEGRLAALAVEGVEEVAIFPLSSRGRPLGDSLAEARTAARSLGASLEWSDRFEPRSV